MSSKYMIHHQPLYPKTQQIQPQVSCKLPEVHNISHDNTEMSYLKKQRDSQADNCFQFYVF